MSEATCQPIVDHLSGFRCNLDCRFRPSFHQEALQAELFRPKIPIGLCLSKFITRIGKGAPCTVDRVRSRGRTAKALVSTLMPIKELKNEIVVRFDRRALISPVVCERK